jgi:hypothetical protein
MDLLALATKCEKIASTCRHQQFTATSGFFDLALKRLKKDAANPDADTALFIVEEAWIKLRRNYDEGMLVYNMEGV